MASSERAMVISDASRITLSLAVVILALAFWMGVSYSQITTILKKQDTYEALVQSIDHRLSRIEGAIERKSE